VVATGRDVEVGDVVEVEGVGVDVAVAGCEDEGGDDGKDDGFVDGLDEGVVDGETALVGDDDAVTLEMSVGVVVSFGNKDGEGVTVAAVVVVGVGVTVSVLGSAHQKQHKILM
jgi:hypothetical protein